MEKLTYPKIRYRKAFTKARVHSKTNEEMSIEALEKRMINHKFRHSQYEPNFLAENNRAAIIAILSKDQDVREHASKVSLAA